MKITIAIWSVAATAVVFINLNSPPDPTQLHIALLFGLLIIFSDTFAIPAGGGYISLLPLISITTFLVLGLTYACLLVFIASIVHGLVRWYLPDRLGIPRPPHQRELVTLVAANGTMFTASIIVSGLVFRSFAVPLPLMAVPGETIAPFALLVITYFATNHLVAATLFRLRGRSYFKPYLSGLPVALLYEITAVTFAPLVALIYTRLGGGYFGLFALALVMASIVMHNLDRVRQRLERRVQELNSLQVIGQTLSASLELEKVLTAVYQQVSNLMPTNFFYVALYEEAAAELSFPLVIKDDTELDWPARPLGNGITEYIIRSRQPLLIRGDVTAVVATLQIEPFGEIPQCWLGVPIIAGDQVLGALSVQSATHSDVYDEGHQEVLLTIAAQAAAAIQNARLYAQTDTALARRVQELDSILETTQEGIMLLDKQWCVLSVNRAFRAMANLEGMTLQGQIVTIWPNEADPLINRIGYTPAELEAECKTLSAKQMPRVQKQITLHGSAERHFERQLAPVYGSQETIAGWLLVFRDVTEEVELEKLRQEMTQMLVHDLRSPLSVMKGSLEILKEELEPLDVLLADSLVDYMEASSDRLLKLVEDVLDIHQFESGVVPLQREQKHVLALFTETAEQFRLALAEMNISLTVDVAEGLPPLLIDVKYMGRVLSNLVDNAIKYTKDNGRICLWAKLADEGMMLLGVDDTGLGVPPAVQSQLFLKFHKDLGGKGRRKGSGLGLSFCKLVVEAHGGQIWVESSGVPGEGSCFKMWLPVARPTLL